MSELIQPITEISEQIVPFAEEEWQRRTEEEAKTRAERLERLGRYVDEAFPGEKYAKLREQIRESFDVPQWGKNHNEGIFLDTHLDLIVKRIESIADPRTADTALEGLDAQMVMRIARAVQSDREGMIRYAFLHDLEKRSTIGLTKKPADSEKLALKVPWDDWQQLMVQYPDPISMRAYLQSLGIDAIGYIDHGKQGAAIAESEGIDPRIVKGIDFHELGYQDGVKTATIRKKGVLDQADIDFIIAVNYLDQSSSLRKDGRGNVSAMKRIERILHNIGVMQQLEQFKLDDESSGYDAEDVERAIKVLADRSDKGERFSSAEEMLQQLKEMNRLKHVNSELLVANMKQLADKMRLIVPQNVLDAICHEMDDAARRQQPQKVGKKIIFSHISDKKLAATIQKIFDEALMMFSDVE